MTADNGLTTAKFAELRKRAQVYLKAAPKDAHTLSQDDVKKLVEELNTYQIELELQNEDLRKTQEELEQSRRRITDLYDFAPVGHLTVSDKGLIVEANLTAAEMLGVSRGLLLKQPLSAFIFDDDQDIHYQCRRKLLDTKEPQTCTFRMRRKDGSLFHAQLKSSVSSEVDGRSGQYRAVLTDISEQKHLEHALLQSKEEWEKTFDAMNDIVTLMDKDLRIVRANKAAHDFFKVKPGELNGQFCYELFRGDSTPCVKCPMKKTLHGTPSPCSENIVHKQLEKIFHVSSAPIFDKNGQLEHLVHIARDITQTKKLEEELFQSHKMQAMGTLAGGIAHDFNNILTAIIGYSSLIKAALPESNPLAKDIEQVLTASNRATELVKQILTFSRKKHGQNCKVLEPQIIVKEVIKMLRATLPTTLELEADIDPNCSPILSDPTQFHQIIVNLCTNAFHAIEDQQGTITIQLSDKLLGDKEVRGELDVSPGLFVELVVKDTGCGIDKDVMDRIFEPYFTTKDFGKGSGIGLAVVFGIIKGQGGLVKVESEVGRGSTFRVYLPAAERHKQDEEENGAKKPSPTGTESILIIDDEEMIANYLKKCLDSLGYTVTAHTESSEALEDFTSRPGDFDLVIADQTMPKIPGSELSKKMLAARHDIPIILCTGYSSMISEDKAREIGIKRFVMKPVDKYQLAVIVREVLDQNKS